MAPSAGMMVTPHVRLVRPIGAGGMGSVWLAYHATLDVEVAVKFIADAALEHAEALARFRREASVAAKLKSPHVAQTFDHGVTPDGVPYIVMERLEGESLAARLDRARLTEKEAGLLLSQVGEVLGRAHAQGIVHRDLKPANLFLIDSGYELFVKVLDFGIARAALPSSGAGLTQSGVLLGTPLYMSPEQIEDPRGADHRADLWALAVLLYEALTGRLPFGGDNVGALSIAIARGVHAPPSSVDPALAPDLDAFFARAFARDPEARFESAAAMVEAFGVSLASSRPRGHRPVVRAVHDPDAPPPGGSDPTTPIAGVPWRPTDDSAASEHSATTASPLANTVPAHPERPRGRRWALVALALVAGASALALLAFSIREPSSSPASASPVSASAASASAASASATGASPAPDVPESPPPPSATVEHRVQPSAPEPAPVPYASERPPVAPPVAVASVDPPAVPGGDARRDAATSLVRGKILGCHRSRQKQGRVVGASALSVTISVDVRGYSSGASFAGPATSDPGFMSCVRAVITNTPYGPGPATTLSFQVSLPAS